MKTQFIFFSGKGGVGKTSMACTHAVRYADEGQRTLIVTTTRRPICRTYSSRKSAITSADCGRAESVRHGN